MEGLKLSFQMALLTCSKVMFAFAAGSYAGSAMSTNAAQRKNQINKVGLKKGPIPPRVQLGLDRRIYMWQEKKIAWVLTRA